VRLWQPFQFTPLGWVEKHRPRRHAATGGRNQRVGAGCDVSGDHAHDVGLLHDQEILTVDLHLGARPLAGQHEVTGLPVDRDQLAGLVAAARADGDDLALLGLLLGGVGNDDAALGLLLGIDTLHDDPVVQGTELELRHDVLIAALIRAALALKGKILTCPGKVETGFPTRTCGCLTGSERALGTPARRVPTAAAEIWLSALPVKRIGVHRAPVDSALGERGGGSTRHAPVAAEAAESFPPPAQFGTVSTNRRAPATGREGDTF